jgi:anthranilate synthase component 1
MHAPDVVTSEPAFVQTARSAPEGARVPVEVRVTVADPFVAYRRARGDPGADPTAGSPDGAYLETTGGQSGWSYFGVDPIARLQVGSR